MYESLPKQSLNHPEVLARVDALTSGVPEDYSGQKYVANREFGEPGTASIVSNRGGVAVSASLLDRGNGTDSRSGVRRMYRAEFNPESTGPKARVTESELVYEGDDTEVSGDGTKVTELPGGVKMVSRVRDLDPSEAATITDRAVDAIKGPNNVVSLPQPPASTSGGDHHKAA